MWQCHVGDYAPKGCLSPSLVCRRETSRTSQGPRQAWRSEFCNCRLGRKWRPIVEDKVDWEDRLKPSRHFGSDVSVGRKGHVLRVVVRVVVVHVSPVVYHEFHRTTVQSRTQYSGLQYRYSTYSPSKYRFIHLTQPGNECIWVHVGMILWMSFLDFSFFFWSTQ